MRPPLSLNRPYAALGGRLQSLRLARGLSQRELARGVGVTQHVISGYEHGAFRPTRHRLGQLAAVLGADEGELVRLAGYQV